MENPLNAIGYRILNATLNAGGESDISPSQLTRRAFLAATAGLSSCSVIGGKPEKPQANHPAAAVRTPLNSSYRTPTTTGPVRRNPDMNLNSDFSKNSGISYSRVLVSGKYLAMTYDDGPHPQNTPRLLDILRARNIKATFFVIGRSVDLYPSILRRTFAEGHEIGNHTHTHRLLTKLSDSEMLGEFRNCNQAIARAAGVQPKVMRPPYGGLHQRQRELAHAEFGFPTIMWSVDPLDWKRPGASVIASRILSGASAGGIVLAHDLHAQTVDAMPGLLDSLLGRGYQFVTVSQLLAMKLDAPATQSAATPVKS